MKAELPLRGCDPMGCGHYGASRGSRKHKGVDYACLPETRIFSPCNGTVTKLGWPYAGQTFRYVQITDSVGNNHRVFYIKPIVDLGAEVYRSTVIGEAQDIAGHHGGGMKNHVHYEIKTHTGNFIDPDDLAVID